MSASLRSAARVLAVALATSAALAATAVSPVAASGAPLLRDGERLELATAPGAPAVVGVEVGAGELVRVRVDQLDADVAIDTYDPAGAPGLSFDSQVRPGGPDFVYLSGAAGVWRLSVRGFEAGDRGRVRLSIDGRVPVGEPERERLRAEALFAEARRLRGEGGPARRGDARRGFEEALALYRRLDDPWRIADCLTYAGGLDLADRRPADSIPRHREALAWLERTGQETRVALTWVNLAWAHDNLADYQAALDAYANALERFDALGRPGGRATALAGVGRIYHALGAWDRAVDAHRQALDAWTAEGQAFGEAVAWSNIGRALDAAGDVRGAERAFRDAWTAADAAGGRRAAQIALRLAGALRRQGRADEARAWLDRAAERYEAAGDPRGRAAVRLERGELALAGAADGTPPDCAPFDAARAAFAGMGDPAGEAAALHGLARCRLHGGDRAAALDAARAAVDRLETLRADVREDELRATFLASHKAHYDLLLRLLFEEAEAASADATRHDAALREAFAVAERARARALLDALHEAGVAADGADAPDAADAADAAGWIRPVDVDGARAGLGPDAALVSWSLAGERAYVFAVTAEDLRAQALEVAPEALEERVAGYVELLAERDGEAWRPVGRRLSVELLDPLRALGPAVRRLVLVPDGALHRLPFEALPLEPDGDPLVARFEVTYAPSATVHRLLAARAPRDAAGEPGAVWVFGAPPVPAPGPHAAGDGEAMRGLELYAAEGFAPGPLPHAAREAREVAAIAGRLGRLWIGAEATEPRLKAPGADAAGVLHLATHGLVSHRSAARSALLLAPSAGGAAGDGDEDGFLQTAEICRLQLRDPLVVLSACESARGPLLAGEGVQGLARGFLFAGARAVVATLWNVGDAATADFMRRFYRRLAEGDAPAAALRAAKLETLAEDATASPRTWAAYVVIGDGGAPVRLADGAAARAAASGGGLRLGWLALVLLVAGGGAWLLRRRRAVG